MPTDPNAEPPKKGKRKAHPLKNPEFRKQYGQTKVKQMNAHKDRAKKIMRTYFKEQEARIEKSLMGTVKNFKKKDLFGEVFDDALELAIAKRRVMQIIRDALVDGGDTAAQFSEGQFLWNSEIRQWLEDRADLFAKSITNTTHERLARAFADSLSLGETRRELMKRVKEIYDGWSTSRVNIIANTEVHGAFQFGTMEGYKQSGVGIKIWVWAPGIKGGVRDEHRITDGEERPLNTPFSNGLMYPGDANAGAGDVVSCECTI